MSPKVTLQIATTIKNIPTKKQIVQWASAALKDLPKKQITIRIVDEKESAQLNQQYRRKQGATNVLSFPLEIPEEPFLLGDIVICAPIVLKEAKEQNKTPISHYAHLVIHGILHLLGHDHKKEKEAHIMEKLEIHIMKQLKFSNPYEI